MRVAIGEIFEVNGGEESSQVVPAGSVRFFQFNLAQSILDLPHCYKMPFLAVRSLCFLSKEEEPVCPGGVVEAVIFNHLFCKWQFLFPEAVLFDYPRPEAPSVVVFMVDFSNDFL